MSYKPGTILERKEPFEAPEADSDEPDLTPYNEIRVVGPSPVVAQGAAGEWGGVTAAAISIAPHGDAFGPVIDKPLGELQRDYSIVTESEPTPLERGEVKVLEYGESPEEAFAREAAERGEEPVAPARPAEPGEDSPEQVFARETAASGEQHVTHKLAPAEVERHEVKPG